MITVFLWRRHQELLEDLSHSSNMDDIDTSENPGRKFNKTKNIHIGFSLVVFWIIFWFEIRIL